MDEQKANATELTETLKELFAVVSIDEEYREKGQLQSLLSKGIAQVVLSLLDLQKAAGSDPAQDLESFQKMLNLAERMPKKGRFSFLGLWASFSENSLAKAYLLGRKHGEQELHSKNQRRATDGRRLIGATSREKIRKASLDFRHMSKETAAPLIAEVVNLSPSTVRRYLSEMFPSNKWG